MARRINAPGIEVNEIDRSSYEETVDNSTIGTATLVLGFADKGDDYNVKWINTMNTFIKTYGNPTTDAERYFYNTVYEILDEGGVCYAAKLPYFNYSMDNFVYTSYSISPFATGITSPYRALNDILEEGTKIYLSSYIALQPSIPSMCDAISSAVSIINDYGNDEEKTKLSSYSQLKDGFANRDSKQMEDLVLAVRQLGDFINLFPVPNNHKIIEEYYEYLKDCINKKIKLGSDFSLNDFLFYPYLIERIDQIIEDEDNETIFPQMMDFITYLKGMSNFQLVDQDFLDLYVLSSKVDKRRSTLEIQKIINGTSHWFNENILSDNAIGVQTSIRGAFGDDATIETIVDDFSKTLYMYQVKEYYDYMIGLFGDQDIEFDGQISVLGQKYTDAAVVDNTITSYAEITQDVSAKNELMSFENYDKFLIKQLRVPQNKIYIVDQTRGKYEQDTFGNEIVGIMPVIVTPANALFYQDVISKRDELLSDYNVVSKIRNSYRLDGTSVFENTIIPIDQTDTKVSSYLSVQPKEFVGLADYLGSESLSNEMNQEIFRVTVNDYTVSQYAAEHFPTMKYISGRLDRQYLNSIGIVVFKLYKDAADENKISFIPVESFVGSLDRDARDETTGAATFIDDVVNGSSDYINVFSNANISKAKDENPLGLKNASIYRISNQVACSMGFYQRDTWKNIHVTESIYRPMLKIFERSEDKNTLDVDIMVDGGVSNIAQFIASTQMHTRDSAKNTPTNTIISDQFQRYGLYDYNEKYAYLFRLESQRDIAVWRKVVERFDDFAKNTRKDLIFIADGPRPLCLEGPSSLIRRSKPKNTVKNTILPKIKFVSGIINSSYSAGYLNWFWSLDHSTGNFMWTPPSIKALGVYLYTDNQGAYWDAPAGLNRGKISGTTKIAFNPTNEEAGQIYVNQWNYAISYPLDGIVLEGQKTFQKNKTALDRVNVRRLMLGLEKQIRSFCKYFNYEGNTEFNRTRLKDTIDRYLEQVRANDGILEYLTVCDERNNTIQTIENNELHITIAVKPVKTIEFIILNFIATNQSANVSEVIASELGS